MESFNVVVHSRITIQGKIGRSFKAAIRREFKHRNPEWIKKKALKFATWGVPQWINTTNDDRETGLFSIPRGGLAKLREVGKQFGIHIVTHDKRTVAPVKFPTFRPPPDPDNPDAPRALRAHQVPGIEAAIRFEQGIIRAPTGSGKTIGALAFISLVGQRAIVIMRDTNLLKQWIDVVVECLGVPRKEIGTVMGGKIRPGKRITLALQQTLYRREDILLDLLNEDPYGVVLVDEVQTVAAKTFQTVIDSFPCRYRIGFSADETRRDGKEFLIYDMFGGVIHDVDRQQLERDGIVHPVTVRVVETEFVADWYSQATEAEERDFTALLAEMAQDEDRNLVVLDLVRDLLARDEVPILLFSHRREHVKHLVGMIEDAFGVEVGQLLGGNKGDDAQRYQDAIAGLKNDRLKVAVGTFHSIGTGIDIPAVRSGVAVTPISKKNKQFFGQVRGRICRVKKGKEDAQLYILADLNVFPETVKTLKKWNNKLVEIFEDGKWKPVVRVR